MIELPFASQVGSSVSTQNSREILTNMFVEVEIGGRKRLIRRQRPGLATLVANTGEKRCIEVLNGVHYTVIGSKLGSFDGAAYTELATLPSVTGRCTMVMNDNGHIMISDGAHGYNWNGTTLTSISASTQIGPVTYQGGYGIFSVPGGGQFYVTAVNDFTTIDPFEFATAESKPDPLVRAFIDHNELWLLGEASTEIWQLSGGADFPFARYSNAQLERGCGAAYSVVADDNTVFWLGDDGVVYRADGYRPVRVSSAPVERLISSVPEAVRRRGDAFFYTYQGNKFYTLSFPDYLSVQYNVSTQLWNLAKTYQRDDWRVIGGLNSRTTYLLTDAGISQLVDGLSTDGSSPMIREGVSAPVYDGGKRVTVNDFFFDAEVGRADMGVDAQIMLRVAKDGETFGNERWRSLGATGDYRRRAIWRNLGQGRNIVVKFFMSDPVDLKIMGSGGNVRGGSS